MRISDRLIYFNPWSEKFHVFEGSTLFQRIRTAITGIFASLALVFASDSTFQLKVQHYHYRRAINLHHRLFALEPSDNLPRIREDGLIESNSAHLVEAIRLARRAFPNLIKLASTESQNAKDPKSDISQLIQIILCGEEAKKASKDLFCFMVRELQERLFPVKRRCYHKSYLNACFHNDGWQKSDIFKCIHQFLTDFMRQPSLRIFDQTINVENLPGFFKQLSQIYLDYIKSHCDEVSGIIKRNKKSPFLRKFMEFFSSKNASISSTCRPSFLSERIQQTARKFAGLLSLKDPVVIEVVLENFFKEMGKDVSKLKNAIIDNGKMLSEDIESIAEKAQCDESDIKSLLWIKMLEVVILFQSLNYAEAYENLQIFLQKNRFNLLSPKERGEHFGQNELQRFFTFPIVVNQNNGTPEKSDELAVATIKTEETIFGYLSEGSEGEITLIKEVIFTWQTTAKIIETFQNLPRDVPESPDRSNLSLSFSRLLRYTSWHEWKTY